MKVFITLLTAMLLSTAALGGDEDSSKSAMATFESLDKNADQQLSRTEAAGDKMLSDSFASIDTNGDGYVSKSEYASAHGKSKSKTRT
ncbi:MAG TPA: hypothetical protein VNQ81_11550 [Povalibacter sp.]|nr:hypothetical protein [Povalibacter sp.]